MPLEAYETLGKIREGLKNMEFASLPAIVKTAQTLSKKVDTMTNVELANLICKDPFAAAKILDMGNKGVGADRLETTNLQDALLGVGFNKLKQVAFSLLDMESAKDKLRHPEQEEAASVALCSCFIAEEILALDVYAGPCELVEGDLYLSTVMRSYGRILMASFCIDEYRLALALLANKGERSAFREALGITPVELTHDLLKETKLPKHLLKTLRPFDASLFENPNPTPADEYLIIAEFALQLTFLTFDYRVPAKKFEKQASDLLADFYSRIKLEFGDLLPIIEELGKMVENLEKQYQIDAVPPHVAPAIECRVAGRDLPRVKARRKQVAGGAKRPPEEILNAGAEEIAFAARKKPLSWEKVFTSTGRVLQEGLGAQETLVLVEEDGVFVPRYGEGDMLKYQKDRVKLTPDTASKNILELCLGHKADALVFDAGKAHIKTLMPNWMTVDNVNALLIMPVLEAERPHLLVAMRTNGAALQLNGPVMLALGKIRTNILAAREVPLAEDATPLKGNLDLKTFNKLMKERAEGAAA